MSLASSPCRGRCFRVEQQLGPAGRQSANLFTLVGRASAMLLSGLMRLFSFFLPTNHLLFCPCQRWHKPNRKAPMMPLYRGLVVQLMTSALHFPNHPLRQWRARTRIKRRFNHLEASPRASAPVLLHRHQMLERRLRLRTRSRQARLQRDKRLLPLRLPKVEALRGREMEASSHSVGSNCRHVDRANN